MPTDDKGLASRHPTYPAANEDWILMRHCAAGPRAVKNQGERYLPRTRSMELDGMNVGEPGRAAYSAYKARAVVPSLVPEAIESLLGAMHYKPPTISLPDRLEPIRYAATVHGESLEQLLIRINRLQLREGRCGLLGEVPDGVPGDAVVPYIAVYEAPSIINWDDGARDEITSQSLNLVVLDEREYEREGFSWDDRDKWRVLMLGEFVPNEREGAVGATYRVGVFREADAYNEADMIEPVIAGEPAREIPFVFVNTCDIVPDPDDPPLMGVAVRQISIYQLDADHRQALHMTGQDTLVVRGLETPEGKTRREPIRVGAGAVIRVIAEGGDAKFVGVSGTGLAEQRAYIEADYRLAAEIGAKLLDSDRAAESGAALHQRVSARTASLQQIALTGAAGLEELLKKLGRWMGLDAAALDEISVVPNTDFADTPLDGRSLVDIMTAKRMGLPLSEDSLHALLRSRGLTDRTLDEERDLLEAESPAGGLPGVAGQPGGGGDDA